MNKVSHSDGLRRLAVAAAILIGMVALLALYKRGDEEAPRASVALMSSIGLQWGEADLREIAAGKAEPAAVFNHLATHYSVSMIDDLSALSARRADVLILVQPRRLAPAELVALDKWVRNGGRLLVFADPALQWPTEFPLGDSRRPLFTSMLSPLFSHWGIELALPMNDQAERMETLVIDGQKINVQSRGIWISKATTQTAACSIDRTEFVADCKIGNGRAFLIADADLLQEPLWNSGLLGRNQMDWVQRVINTLLQKPAAQPR